MLKSKSIALAATVIIGAASRFLGTTAGRVKSSEVPVPREPAEVPSTKPSLFGSMRSFKVSPEDHERIQAAQAKRDRKAAKRRASLNKQGIRK